MGAKSSLEFDDFYTIDGDNPINESGNAKIYRCTRKIDNETMIVKKLDKVFFADSNLKS
jgi:hypothetical protein